MGEFLNIDAQEIAVSGSVVRRPLPLQRLASRWRFIACIQTLDFLFFSLIALAWFRTLVPETTDRWVLHAGVSLLVAAMLHCLFQSFRLYDFKILTKGMESALRAFAAILIAFGPFLAPLLIQPDTAARPAVTACILVAFALSSIALWRLVLAGLARALQQTGIVDQRVYLIADSNNAMSSLRRLLEQTSGCRIAGTWTLPETVGSIDGAMEGALAYVRDNPIDLVILKMPLDRPDRLIEVARVLRSQPRTVLLAPSLYDGDHIVLRQNTSSADGINRLALVRLSDRPLSGWRWVVKDIQDRALALLLLIVIAPAMLVIACAIKLSNPGPVFFRQKRYGYASATFDIIKFRTMRASNGTENARNFKMTTKNDPRVFPVGRLLRKTSLDELPQLLNVLRGDMWIIGPRPHSPFAKAGGLIYGQAVQEYAARYRIKPGITGWAQVCGWRGPTETREQLTRRVEHDLYYIENWSTAFDVRILFKTLFCAFGHKNAF
jgi:Undecaprenyl-phosphate glucose phosphotransferase